MSAERTAQRQTQAPPAGMFGRGPMGGFGMPVQKAKDFKGTLRRLLGYLEPHRPALIVVIVRRRHRHHLQRRRPEDPRAWRRRRCSRAIWRAPRRARRADRLRVRRPHPAWLVVLYVISAVFHYLQQYLMAGIAQKTVYAMRKDVEAKFERLPLKFYDSRTHGEILSRAVNDMDNISGTLQQNLTQLITSILMLIGVIVMMLTISWILTLVVVLTLPLSLVLVARDRQAVAEATSCGSRRRSAS